MPSSKPEATPGGHETLDAGVETPDELVSFEQYASTMHGGAPPSIPATEHELSPYDSQSTEGAAFLSLSSFEDKMMDMPEGGLQLTSDPLIGRFVNNMQVLSRLGSGGFGAVYLAEHTELRTPFAIKILNLFQSGRAEVVERFRREARAIALLNHPNIVKIADFGWLDGYGYYLVMEYLEGQSLREVIDLWDLSHGPIPVPRIHELTRQLCGALRLVHHKGIVHRDLKPSNIVLVPGQRVPEVVKLIDFGIASLSDDDSLTASGVCMGSPAYMSPEQADGLSSTLDARSDLYSLAIILYQLLTGELPFIGRGLASYVRMHLLEPPPPLRERCPSKRWHPSLEDLIQRSMAKEPEARPRDINEFWELCDRAFEAQTEYEAMAPVVETHILPGPTPKSEPQPAEETFLFSADKTQANRPYAATIADPQFVMPEGLELLEEAANNPVAEVVVAPSSQGGLPWIVLLLLVLIVFAGLGVWGLSRVTQTPLKPSASSIQITQQAPGRLPQMMKRSLPVPALPRRVPRQLDSAPGLSTIAKPQPLQVVSPAGARAPPRRALPRPVKRPPPRRYRRRRRSRRRRRRRYRRRRRRRKRRTKRRKSGSGKTKTKKRDVFGFNKDPV